MKLSEKGIIIRKTSEADLRSIYLSVYNNPLFISAEFNAEIIADLFMSDNSIMFTAVRKKKVLGFIAGKSDRENSFIKYIFVNDKFRGSGIGSALIENFVIRGKKILSRNFFIALSGCTIESLNFYCNRGFIQFENRMILIRKEP